MRHGIPEYEIHEEEIREHEIHEHGVMNMKLVKMEFTNMKFTNMKFMVMKAFLLAHISGLHEKVCISYIEIDQPLFMCSMPKTKLDGASTGRAKTRS